MTTSIKFQFLFFSIFICTTISAQNNFNSGSEDYFKCSIPLPKNNCSDSITCHSRWKFGISLSNNMHYFGDVNFRIIPNSAMYPLKNDYAHFASYGQGNLIQFDAEYKLNKRFSIAGGIGYGNTSIPGEFITSDNSYYMENYTEFDVNPFTGTYSFYLSPYNNNYLFAPFLLKLNLGKKRLSYFIAAGTSVRYYFQLNQPSVSNYQGTLDYDNCQIIITNITGNPNQNKNINMDFIWEEGVDYKIKGDIMIRAGMLFKFSNGISAGLKLGIIKNL